MCGIIVSTSTKTDIFSKKETLISRGPDQTSIIRYHDVTFGFFRLAIMDESSDGMQPFFGDEVVVVANAEIYNYKQIKKQFKGYPFQSKSDCEVLIPLYQELKTELFSFLDAEFAIVIYDAMEDEIIAGRDPIGIRPLFYGFHKEDHKIMFASEGKALLGIVEKVHPFPPGHYYYQGQFVKYHDIDEVNEYHNELIEEVLPKIKEKLELGVLKRLDSDAEMGFLLSGGLDSSLVCAIAQKQLDTPIKTFAVGMEYDAIDLKYAKTVADYIGSDHTEVIISKTQVIEALEEVIYALESYDITTVRASIGMYLISKYIHENTTIKVLMTGEVSDELFGYKYTDFAPNPESFQKESIKRVQELFQYDVLRADRCLAANSLEARVPFADLDFVRYVLRIHPFFKMNRYNMGKFLLRKAFEKGTLPESILYREKAAFSDAVGHSLVDELKSYAERVISDEQFEEEKGYYTPVPFSKEALLYRKIFDKFYHQHEHLVPGYWMPNKEWQGCNVDDPSARVLSNYGKSGL